MTEEKQKLLDKIYDQLNYKKKNLISQLPNVHRIDDGIVIRFFTEWDHCVDDNHIKWKKIENVDVPEESVVFFYLPKGSQFELKQRFFIGCMTCLNGEMDVDINGEITHLNGYQKICVNSEDVKGNVLQNTYLITTSNKANWSKTTNEYVKEVVNEYQ